ncbi:spore germination protein [Bacillus cereus]|uniref:spore germination protein n=1 Tax=Bacillus cereus TaxID=1396 RepID=UPI000BF73638|nr:spore germination protein [Bacillus cereus]PFN17573.1 spore germination protein [Bacillus cereus]
MCKNKHGHFNQLGEIIQMASLEEQKNQLLTFLNHSDDLVQHQLHLHNEAILFYIEGLTDGNVLKENVLKPLLQSINEIDLLYCSKIITTNTTRVDTWKEVTEGLLEGQSVLFVNGIKGALIINTKGWAERPIQEPVSESTINGSHDGFIENASKNLGLIRRYIPSPQLKVKKMTVGERAPTQVYIIYLVDVANNDIVEEIKKRIKNIKTDTILNTGELSNFTKRQIWTPFPHSYLSERPDAITRHILDGKIAVLVDRSPSAMVVPMNFIGFFQTPDDYSLHWIIASSLRLLRLLGFFIAIFLPSIYIAMVTFHFEVIPLNLYLSIAHSRIKVPFSPLMEALMMEFTLEMLREAGVRLPQSIGQTIGIVGGIVIGQAAVQAGIVSNVMVIVVSVTAIASFIVSNYDLATCIRFIRFPMMLFSYAFGLVGIVTAMMMLLAHIITLNSFGAPYGLPLAPLYLNDWKDSFIRFPISMLTKRSSVGNPQQKRKKKYKG